MTSSLDINDNLPLVSIGIPAYNVEPYIEKCLLSVLNQTYCNLEIIVVDDLCTDKTMAIVEELQRNNKRGWCIKTITQTQNGGSGEARNAVISKALGKYIYFLDSDDYIELNTIELMVEQALEHHTDAVIASLRKVVWNSEDELPTLQYKSYELIKGKNQFAYYVCQDLRWHIAITACNILFRTDFLRNNNLHFLASKDEDALFLSDYYSEIECAVIMPNITYNYVIRPGSKMGNNARSVIPVNEIRDRFVTDEIMTQRCKRLRNLPYYDVHCARVMKHKFRAACVAVKHYWHFSEHLSIDEIHKELKHPSTFLEVLRFKRYKCFHLFFFFLSKLPSSISYFFVYIIGKIIKWI